MAMILIDKKEIEENSELFIIETYQSNKTGRESVVKYSKPSDVTIESIEPQLTETEEAILNTAINTEYLVCLAELGL